MPLSPLQKELIFEIFLTRLLDGHRNSVDNEKFATLVRSEGYCSSSDVAVLPLDARRIICAPPPREHHTEVTPDYAQERAS